MEIGLNLPHVGSPATPDAITTFAQTAEAAGFDSLWVADHVVLHRDGASGRYPYSDSGEIGIRPTVNFLEPLATLMYVAGLTTQIQLGTAVLVLPMREPVLHAKWMASLDFLSNGRFICGAGVGWWKEEFDVLGVPFSERGRRMDECLELYKALWSEEFVSFDGEFYQVDGWACNPKPVRPIPIWLGGESPQQMRRVGQYADGWLATAASKETLAEDFAAAQSAADAVGRDPTEIKLGLLGAAQLSGDKLEQAAETLIELRESGVDLAIVRLDARTAGYEGILQEFGDRYLADIRG
jgi:probable F420-dependent oxidoreductase